MKVTNTVQTSQNLHKLVSTLFPYVPQLQGVQQRMVLVVNFFVFIK